MNFGDYVPPVLKTLAGRIAKSFISDFLTGRDVDGGGSTARLLHPYRQSTWVYSAINLIGGELSGLPLKFYQGDAEYTEPAFDAWWQKPALGLPTSTGGTRLSIAEVTHDLIAWFKLEGEMFIVLDDSWLVTAQRRAPGQTPPFIVAKPSRMRHIVQGGVLLGWEYIDAGGYRTVYLPDQVIYRRSFNPDDDWRGLGALTPALVAAEGAYLTSHYVRELMRNNNDQGAIIIGKNVATPEQRAQITADLAAKRTALRRGQAKDLFLTGDISVDRPKQETASTDLNATRGMSHEEVYIAFGVPPSMASAKSNYSLGKDSDRYQLITGTSQPMGTMVATMFAEVAIRMSGRSLTAEYEWDNHPVMVEVRNARIDTASKLWGMGMPMRSINDLLGLGMQSFPGWDKGYLPFSVAPVDATGLPEKVDPATDPALAEPVDTDPQVQALRVLLLARQRAAESETPAIEINNEPEEFRIFTCSCHGAHGATMKGRSEKEIRLWRSHMATRIETLKTYESGIRRELMKARAETLSKIERLHATKSVIGKAAAADLVFDRQTFKDGFFAMMRSRAKTALNTAGTQLFKEVGKDDPFVYPPGEALTFLSDRENKLAGVPDEIHDTIISSLQDGLGAGDTMDQLSARIRATFNDINGGRARVIAATEVGAAYGVARDKAMRDAAVPAKTWLTSGNANVRPAHAAANNQTVSIDEPFIVDGEELDHPGDPKGSASNVISCHCVSIASATL